MRRSRPTSYDQLQLMFFYALTVVATGLIVDLSHNFYVVPSGVVKITSDCNKSQSNQRAFSAKIRL